MIFGEYETDSAEGIQQGDHLLPLCYIYHPKQLYTAVLSIWYLGEGTVAGTTQSLSADFILVKERWESQSLFLTLPADP